ncbi:hypothetical protein [Candidatus Borrarchaeum sp.]|uniref:hypothetical protein n=1 Tax=Candidatus Borrarchaeum sp. TaxID=2846742 RepID=UPI0025795A81|nr:hypothetical protein [Candidatus Borrarchaeum sp.]
MGFTEFLKDISLIVASCTAIYGIGSWHREYKGKRQAELAEEVLSLFYEARDAIKHIRNPFSHAGEGATRKQSENESADEKKAYDQAYVVFERYNANLELFNRLHSLRYRFMTQFGEGSAKPFVELRKILNEIFASAQTLANLWAKQRTFFRTDQASKEHFEFKEKLEAIFWEGLADEDPINPKLEKCVQDIEVMCRGILSEKSIWKKIKENPLYKMLKQKIANKANSADAKNRAAD